MNRRVLITLETASRPLPAAAVFAGRVFTLAPVGGDARSLTTAEDHAEFGDLAPGKYALKVQDMRKDGPLGEPVLGEVVIPGDEVPPGGTYMAAVGFSYVVA